MEAIMEATTMGEHTMVMLVEWMVHQQVLDDSLLKEEI